jgi:TolB-like protein/Tfp pilus assembly protein PilF
MGETGNRQPDKPSTAPSPPGRLDSWKEIASYLKRDVTTAQRWERREGMPVHRHLHDRSGSVYAFASELDAWLQGRSAQLKEEKEAEPRGEPDVALIASADPEPNSAPAPATMTTRRWVVLSVFVLFAFAALAYVVGRSRPDTAPRPQIRSLAVLPLRNLSGDAAQEYLADGMTEALVGRLSGIHDLRVISRTSVMRFKETQLSVPEIAKALGVDAIVEGSVIRQGSRVRVHAQLIRASTDEHFWSEAYDRDLQDVLALQSEVAQSIARKVEISVSGEEHARLASVRSVAPEVYESYLKGRFSKDNSRAEVEQSIAFFNDAIRKDPTFAPAYVGLAAAYDRLGTVLVGVPPGDVRPKVMSYARKALELDPQNAGAHALLANVLQHQWHWAEAETEYQRALELNPNDPVTDLAFSSWLLCQGRMEEALTWSERARTLDPLGLAGENRAWILFHSRRYDEAVRELRSVLALHPDDATPLWFLGFTMIAKNQPGEAITVLEKVITLTNRAPGPIGVLIRAYAHAGRSSDARKLLAELKERSQTGYVPAAAFVNAYLGLGDNEQAFAWLERAHQEQSNILQFLKVHPYFDPLRDDPRFKDLLRRVGLS